MPQLTGSLSHLLAPGLTDVYNDELSEQVKTDQYPTFVNVETTQQAYEQFVKVSGIGALAALDEGGAFDYEEISQSDVHTITVADFGKGISISENLIDDDLYNIAERATQKLARAAKITFEIQAFDLFNAGFVTTTRVGIDDLALFSAVHPLMNPQGTAPGNPTTYSNTATAALGYASLQAAIEAFMDFRDEEGYPSPITPVYLMVRPTDSLLAEQLCSAGRGEYGTPDNQIQPTAFTKLQPITVNWFTNTGMWVLIGAKADHDLALYVRKQPNIRSTDDPYTRNALFSVKARMVPGFVLSHGVYGAKP